jgi:protein TonB
VAEPTPARDEQLESLLKKADAAYASGALVAPPNQSAVDLYKQALRHNSTDPRAAAGLEKIIAYLLSSAESQLAAQHLDEAQKLTDQARAIEPDHVRVAFLGTQIGKARERFVLNQARQAASSGNLEQAIAVIDGTGQDDKHSPPVAEAPALAAGDAENAQQRIDAAADSGVSRDDIADLTREAQQVQTTAKADATARLTLHDVGTDDPSITAVEHDMATAQQNTRHAKEVVSAANLELVKYVPPKFPDAARRSGMSGWVDVQLVVGPDGSVSDVIITGAEPAGMFEQAAVDAVRKWRYKPVEREGHAIDQRARLRMKFALDK